MPKKMKRYLGDGVYADWDGQHIVLTAENGITITNRIYINAEVLKAFNDYVTQNFNPV